MIIDSNSKKCLNCGNSIIKKENKFCNSSCAASYNNKKSPKREKKARICLNCGKTIDNYQNKYCNLDCFQEYRFKQETLPNFYKGKVNFNTTLKRVLIYLFGEKCTECGNGKIWNNKPLTLQVDHKDGNSDNNFPNNLRLLCPNCHTQTDTFSCHHTPKSTKRNNKMREYRSKKKMVSEGTISIR